MKRILSVSSSRADVGILAPVWAAIAQQDDLHLTVFSTGMNRRDPSFLNQLIPPGVMLIEGGTDLGGGKALPAAVAMADIASAAATAIAEANPDILFVVGDRIDMFPVVMASLPFNLPVAHLHGGEITEGAIDDRVRHAISKIAHLHFASSNMARDRLMSMGEREDRIIVSGAPGLDQLKAADVEPRPSFLSRFGLCDGKIRLVTVHPETNSANPEAPLDAILQALDQDPEPVVFTSPNSDPAGRIMEERIRSFVGQAPNRVFVETLGALYASALRHASVMIGNSSSGIIEADLFGLSVIDIGSRQAGRERGRNVTSVAADARQVGHALEASDRLEGRFAMQGIYGDGQASARIAKALVALPNCRDLLNKSAPLSFHPTLEGPQL
jgi:UDP-hydrolysing UDP-N-acetyl-D-glucosamine 2-epimerase